MATLLNYSQNNDGKIEFNDRYIIGYTNKNVYYTIDFLLDLEACACMHA